MVVRVFDGNIRLLNVYVWNKKWTEKRRKQHKSELHKSYKTVAKTSQKSKNNLRNNSFHDGMSFYLLCLAVKGLMVEKQECRVT